MTDHEGFIVWREDGHRFQAVEDEVQDLGDGVSLVLTALVELFHVFCWDVQRRAKFDDGARAEAMGMEVGQSDGHDGDLQTGRSGQGA